MKHTFTLLAVLMAATVAQAAEMKLLDDKPAADWVDAASTLWYRQPATRFYQSLPLGNGRIGAMAFGGVDEERIILNESSVWSGSREDSDRTDAHKALPEIRRLLLEGKNVEAEALVNQNFTCQNQGSGHARGANLPFGCYQTLGNLRLKFTGSANAVANYRRTLDLATAAARVTYQRDGVAFARDHFVSAPDEVFVSRLTGPVSFTLSLDRTEATATAAAVTRTSSTQSRIPRDGSQYEFPMLGKYGARNVQCVELSAK